MTKKKYAACKIADGFRIRCSTIYLKTSAYYRVNWVSKEQGLFTVLYPHWLLINSSHNIEKIHDSFATTATERNCQPPPGELGHVTRYLKTRQVERYNRRRIKRVKKVIGVACETSRFSSLVAAGDVSRWGTFVTQRSKFHTDDENQCLHNKSGSQFYVSSDRFW